jgi:hypothetical protein
MAVIFHDLLYQESVEMVAKLSEERLAEISTSERVLLISQCLRPSKTCNGKFGREGLECVQDCKQPCIIRQFREATSELGYGGVCVAAGGAMALKFVRNRKPKGIIAIACKKELKDGVDGVRETFGEQTMPVIVVVPLTKDGCVDTEVDTEQVLRTINLRPVYPSVSCTRAHKMTEKGFGTQSLRSRQV